MTRLLKAILWLLVGCGLTVNSILAWKLADRGLDGPLVLPGCTAGGFDCESVLTSPYSQVLGVSLTLWAFAYYAAVLGLLTIERRTRPFGALALSVVAAPAVAAAVWFPYVMHARLQEHCPWCLVDHAINLAFFFTAVLLARNVWRQTRARRVEALEPPLSPRWVHLSVNAAILLTAWTATVLVFMHASTELAAIPVSGGSAVVDRVSFAGAGITLTTVSGDPKSERRVTMFSCPTCSHCRRVHALLEEISREEPLRIEMRFAPLDPSCNPVWSTEEDVAAAHRQACELVRIALAVAATDEAAFAPFADWLYTNQRGMTVERAAGEARQRVDAVGFDAAVTSAAVSDRLEADVRLAKELDVRSVPRLFVAGGPLIGPILRENLAVTLRRTFAVKEGAHNEVAPGRD
ncbi:MAG: thioredoxin domain-containing protein [Planctomycetaceae bacterium]|nr:thioredoxin domain-containing protein [Planctomycetaceae bacterium]